MHAPAAVPMMFAVLLATASVLLLATVSRAELTSLGADEPTPLFNNNTIYVTGKDGRVRSNVKGIDPCHSDPDGPKLECTLFTLCEPGTTKMHENGLVYRGENESNECSIFDDACCVPDLERVRKYLEQPQNIAEIAKKART